MRVDRSEAIDRFDGEQRRRADEATNWLRTQADRLNITPEAVDAAIRTRGWLPDEIETVETAAELLTNPPQRQGAAGLKLREANG